MKRILAGIFALMFAFNSGVFELTGYVSVVKKIKESKEFKEHKKHCFKHIKKRKIVIDYKYETMDDGTAVMKSPSGEVLFKFKDKVIFDPTCNKIADYSELCIYSKVNTSNITMIMINPNGEIFETRNFDNKYESFKKGRISEGSTAQLSAIYKKKSKICQFDKCIPKAKAIFISFFEDLNLVNTNDSGNVDF